MGQETTKEACEESEKNNNDSEICEMNSKYLGSQRSSLSQNPDQVDKDHECLGASSKQVDNSDDLSPSKNQEWQGAASNEINEFNDVPSNNDEFQSTSSEEIDEFDEDSDSIDEECEDPPSLDDQVNLYNNVPAPNNEEFNDAPSNQVDLPDDVPSRPIPQEDRTRRGPDSISTTITKLILHVIEAPSTQSEDAMIEMIDYIKQSWTMKEFLTGFMKYLMHPARNQELHYKLVIPPAPPMTHQEQILLYVVTRMNWDNIDIINAVLDQMEHCLLRSTKTKMESIESMSHFYVLLCRYTKKKKRLYHFILSIMYFLNLSAVTFIKQCFEVSGTFLPLADSDDAKKVLVPTLVYLLHFFEYDHIANKDIRDLRTMLCEKYGYTVKKRDLKKIVKKLKRAILNIQDDPIDRKSLGFALLLLGKRQGSEWCQNKLIDNIFVPIILMDDVPENVLVFCVSYVGELFKPYRQDMRIHCDIVIGYLIDMLDNNPSPMVQEAIYKSLLAMRKHNEMLVIQAVMLRRPELLSRGPCCRG